MEFLAFVFPGALLVDIAFVRRFLRDRRLVKLVLTRYAEVFDGVRGGPRRWHDDSEIMYFQRSKVRRSVLHELEPRAASDPELAAAIGDVRMAERWLRTCAWIAAGITIACVLGVTLLYHSDRPTGP